MATGLDRGKAGSAMHVAVVGAGVVGLSTAWFLQERGVRVTVLDRVGVAAGSSWGNAGWLSPALAAPLPEPAVLRYGVRAVLDKRSPLRVPVRPDPKLLRFLIGFARSCTQRQWDAGMAAFVPLNRAVEASFALLESGGVTDTDRKPASVLAVGRDADDLSGLVHELEAIRRIGQDVKVEFVDGDDAREIEPILSDQVRVGLRITDQATIDPGKLCGALGESIIARGGVVRSGQLVTDLQDSGAEVRMRMASGQQEVFDAVVVATGAWLSRLAGPHGVTRSVQAGRGYSFTVDLPGLANGPIYLPRQRVACSPLSTGLRIAGTMEMVRPDAPLNPGRVASIAASVGPMLAGLDLDARRDPWVGSRPCTADGLPLIGETRNPRIFVNGGHGMWGVTHGPVSGQLLAEAIVSGRTAPELRPFSPLRR
jgi:D-amino-acid dehydrogenase